MSKHPLSVLAASLTLFVAGPAVDLARAQASSEIFYRTHYDGSFRDTEICANIRDVQNPTRVRTDRAIRGVMVDPRV
jgi:hypothetical protein